MRVHVSDNDELIVVANVSGASVSDPVNAIGAVAQLFRVVASKKSGCSLSLVPIGGTVRLASEDMIRLVKELEAQ